MKKLVTENCLMHLFATSDKGLIGFVHLDNLNHFNAQHIMSLFE